MVKLSGASGIACSGKHTNTMLAQIIFHSDRVDL